MHTSRSRHPFCPRSRQPQRAGAVAVGLVLLVAACQQMQGSTSSSESVVVETAGAPPPAAPPEPSPARPARPLGEAPEIEAVEPEPLPAPAVETPVEVAEPMQPQEQAEPEPASPAAEAAPVGAEPIPAPEPEVVIGPETETAERSTEVPEPDITVAGETSAAAAGQVPQFPWPPPRASAMAVVPAAFVRPPEIESPTLGDVDDQISAALDAGGYFERSYYAVPGGFAMVTRLERINPDGTPIQDEAERWAVDASPLRQFSLSAYLRALFTAPTGRYRIIVFVVSSKPFAQSEVEVGRSEAIAWLSEGLNRLPDSIAASAYTEGHTVTALIYEFEQPGRQEAVLLVPGNLMGRVHLQRAMLWDAFRQ